MTFENINFAISINYYILTLLVIIAVGYSYYIYKYTIPQTSSFVKFILILLRSSAIILIIIILFEPVIIINYIQTNKPTNLLLIDNSSSIINKDSTRKKEKIYNFISDYKYNLSDKKNIATFGKTVKQINFDEETTLNFDEPVTNFDKIVPYVKNIKEDIATITIVTDGIITQGSNSTNEIEKLNIPFFTIAVGDTTKPSDVGIIKVEFNKIIYLNNITEIKGVISNNNYSGKNVIVSLFDRSGVVDQKQIKLNKSGINNIDFNYEPKEIGKQNLRLSISHLENEETYVNNKYPFVIEVLKDKTNVLVISGAPSPDLSTIIKSLDDNTKIKLNKIIQISDSKFLDNGNTYVTKIDSAEIILMIDFPTSKTSNKLLSNIKNKLELKKTPYFLFLSEQTDYNKLQTLNNALSFKTKTFSNGYFLTQAEIRFKGNGIFNDKSLWNKFAPIKTNNKVIELKNSSSLLASGKSRDVQLLTPILFTSKIASSRNIVFNGYNFWKWKIQSDAYLENTFDMFLTNSIKWLSTKKEKRIFVKPTKDIYSTNESVEFVGNVYDETLTPINDAIIEVEIFSANFNKILKLEKSNNGIYIGTIDISSPNTFNYKATVNNKNKEQLIVKGNFLISDIEVENINFVLNSNYLKFISNVTSGKSFNIDNYSNLFQFLKMRSDILTKDEIISTKFDLWRNKWILFLIIMLFVIDWIIRKQKGML